MEKMKSFEAALKEKQGEKKKKKKKATAEDMVEALDGAGKALTGEKGPGESIRQGLSAIAKKIAKKTKDKPKKVKMRAENAKDYSTTA